MLAQSSGPQENLFRAHQAVEKETAEHAEATALLAKYRAAVAADVPPRGSHGFPPRTQAPQQPCVESNSSSAAGLKLGRAARASRGAEVSITGVFANPMPFAGRLHQASCHLRHSTPVQRAWKGSSGPTSMDF